jgi:arylsulfatase
MTNHDCVFRNVPAGPIYRPRFIPDDAGFGSSSALGGSCQSPVAERLAGSGLRYT